MSGSEYTKTEDRSGGYNLIKKLRMGTDQLWQ